MNKNHQSRPQAYFFRRAPQVIGTVSLGPLLLGLLLSAGAGAAKAGEARTIPEFKRIVIDDDPPRQPWYKLVGDVTGDGNLDIIVAGRVGPIVSYSRPDWKKTVLARGGHAGVRGSLADINGDGMLDLVMGGVVWFENPGPAGGDWKMHRIDSVRTHDVLVADLSGNGLPDVVARDQGNSGHAVYIYHQETPNSWRKEVLECPPGEGVTIADMDGDGKPDVVLNGIWFRNDAGKWTRHAFAFEWTHPHAKVEAGDVNGNGRLDIVMVPAEHRGQRYRISWFESPAGDKTQPWKEHVIVSEVECVVHSLALGDFNHDGALDVAYAEMHQGEDPDEVVVMFNFQGGTRWEKRVIDTEGSHDIVAADLNGDGNLDLVGANHDGVHPVVIWENQINKPID